MKNYLSELDPELKQLFEAESEFPTASLSAKSRVWQKVGREIGIPGAAGAESGEAADAASGNAPGSSGAGTTAGLSAKTAGTLISVFVGGTLFGAAAYHLLDPHQETDLQPPPVALVEQPEPEAAPRQPEDTSFALANEPEPEIEAQAPSHTTTQETQPAAPEPRTEDRESRLSRERALIDLAQAAIARGNSQSAFSALERHREQFPRGLLQEERRGLRVIALARAGRLLEAREQAVRFRTQYPRSLLLPSIEAMIGSE